MTQKHSEGQLKRYQNPEEREKTKNQLREARLGKKASEETRERIREARLGKKASEETKQKMRKSHIGLFIGEKNPMFNKTPWNKGIQHSKETRERIREALLGKKASEETKEKMVEAHICGFWYGNVRYNENKYCELWGPDLWRRIDTFWGDKSTLSGKINKNGHKLSRHHVYYNKKSCCLENDDGSFSVEINGQVYPIIGDPNKFVLLTRDEHNKIIGSYNKIWYMRYFEWLINTKFAGKSYYTQDEYEALKMEFS